MQLYRTLVSWISSLLGSPDEYLTPLWKFLSTLAVAELPVAEKAVSDLLAGKDGAIDPASPMSSTLNIAHAAFESAKASGISVGKNAVFIAAHNAVEDFIAAQTAATAKAAAV